MPPAADPAGPKPAPARPASRRLDRFARLVVLAGRTHAVHQAAALRIGFGFVFAAFLLREWPRRRVLYGDRCPLSLHAAGPLLAHDHLFTVLTWWSGRWWFEIVYHGALVAAVLFMLGWRTRATSVLFMVGVLSVENRNPFVGDAGDTLIRIMAVHLVFTRCAQVWSLDARRARLHGGTGGNDRVGVLVWQAAGLLCLLLHGGLDAAGRSGVFWALWGVQGLWYAAGRSPLGGRVRAMLDSGAAMLHNCAMLVTAAQVCLVYSAAGWYKLQGERWRAGDAVYYPLHLDYFAPWPRLAEQLTAGMPVVSLLSYATVALQVAFPFALLHRRTKNVLLAAVVLEHVGMAAVLGIPFLSAAVIVSDAVLLPTALLLRTEGRCLALAGRVRRLAGPARAAGRPVTRTAAGP